MDIAVEELKNLGPVSAGWLRSTGIRTLGDLKRIGAVEAWFRVREQIPEAGASKVLLYALEGALTDTHWAKLPPETKRELQHAAR